MSDLLSLKTVIRTKNFEASKVFYGEYFKLPEEESYDDGDGSRGVIFRFGDESSNGLLEISEIRQDHYYHQKAFDDTFQNDKIDIQLKTKDIDYWVKRLDGKCEMRGPILRPWGSYYLYLRDPDGLQIIIYQDNYAQS